MLPQRLPHVQIKAGHVRPVWAGHPWVFSQAVERIEGGATPGDEVLVVDPRGTPLGRGLYSPQSAICVRLYTTQSDVPLDGHFFRARIREAAHRRSALSLPDLTRGSETTGYRVIHAEGDGLSGLTVDLFEDVLVVQLSTLGIKLREGVIFDALQELFQPRAIVDRTPAAMAEKEGFEPASGIVRGDTQVTQLSFWERGLRFHLPFTVSQKTGYYFDQRAMRGRVESLARGKRVLDVYSFVGGFGLGAARGGAKLVRCVDSSAPALEQGSEIAVSNGLKGIEFVRLDARKALEEAAHKGGYDLVICDPPKLSPTKAARKDGLMAYARLAAAACAATTAGGVLLFCSCSAAVSMEELVRALAEGARKARRRAVVFERWVQGHDHPTVAAFPEGLYLKGIFAFIEKE